MQSKNDQIPNEVQSKSSSSTSTSELVDIYEEENEDSNVSYSDTSLDGGGLTNPPPRMIKVQRRRCFIKHQG